MTLIERAALLLDMMRRANYELTECDGAVDVTPKDEGLVPALLREVEDCRPELVVLLRAERHGRGIVEQIRQRAMKDES